MSTENAPDTSASGGGSTESTSANVSTPAVDTATTTSTPQTASAGAATPQSGSMGTIDPGAAGLTPTGPVYTPNFKYKAALQEKELDAFWHPLVKDADSEKKVKEVFTKADAFEYMKEKLESRSGDYDSLLNDYQRQSGIINKTMEARKKGDFDSVFRNIGMSDHEVISWAAKRVDYLQTLQRMPPEQRALVEKQQQAALQNEHYEEQLSQLQNSNRDLAVQARTTQLEVSLSRPEVTQVAQFWDNKMGTPGAFREMVIEEGKIAHFTQQTDITPEQAVQRVMQKFGKFIDVGNGAQPGAATPQTMNGAPTMPGQKPVIPVIPGASKTPIKKQFRSIDDLKKHAKEMEARDAASL